MDEEEAQFYKLNEISAVRDLPEEKKKETTAFYILRGERYLARGNTGAARVALKKAQDLDPTSIEVKTYLESIRDGTTDELLLPADPELIPTLPEYRIRLNDVLDISVWQHRELANQITVRPDGRISFPLVGDVWAYNLTPAELSREVAIMVSEYVRSPKVTVSVVKFAGDRVVILGQVASPGMYEIGSKDRVLDLIARGGGFAHGAVKGKILLIRHVNRLEPETIVVNAAEMLRGQGYEYNLPLQNFDVVYVPKSTISNVSDFITRTILPAAITVLTGAQATHQMQLQQGASKYSN